MPEHYCTLVEAQPGSRLTLTVDATSSIFLKAPSLPPWTNITLPRAPVGIVMDVNHRGDSGNDHPTRL